MPQRRMPPTDPVWIEHDGDRIPAARGESVAAALLAADRVLLSRSPKLHRPRGPSCLRGGCDGCLARVDGEPNVMTCLRRVEGGERIETQNVLGTRGMDLMEAADFLFPRGIDHHKLFAGIRGVSSLVQSFARRVAGLGTLPDEAKDVMPARRREVDVLIVGSGRAGQAVATRLREFDVCMIDDALRTGATYALQDPVAAAQSLAQLEKVDCHPATTAIALSREPGPGLSAVLGDARGAWLCQPRAVVLATGCHDYAPAFGENDLPGIFSARAALSLLHGDITVGQRVALIGRGHYLDVLRKVWGGELTLLEEAEVRRCAGRGRVRAVVMRDGNRRITVDAVVTDGPGAPAFELAVQSGADVQFDGSGFAPRTDATGSVSAGVWAVGSVVANRVTPDDVAEAVRRWL
ncbi:MAG: 2Fe-2S iron-sulfur cluster-binding protein [Polyangiaceae bacterium]